MVLSAIKDLCRQRGGLLLGFGTNPEPPFQPPPGLRLMACPMVVTMSDCPADPSLVRLLCSSSLEVATGRAKQEPLDGRMVRQIDTRCGSLRLRLAVTTTWQADILAANLQPMQYMSRNSEAAILHLIGLCSEQGLVPLARTLLQDSLVDSQGGRCIFAELFKRRDLPGLRAVLRQACGLPRQSTCETRDMCLAVRGTPSKLACAYACESVGRDPKKASWLLRRVRKLHRLDVFAMASPTNRVFERIVAVCPDDELAVPLSRLQHCRSDPQPWVKILMHRRDAPCCRRALGY